MTKLEEEKLSKKKAGELEEYLDTVGQENETKAAKWVIEDGKQANKEKAESQAKSLTFLENANKATIMDYKRKLADLLTVFALREGYPPDWDWKVVITDKGIVMWLADPAKKVYYRAFTPTHLPEYDLNAAAKVLESAWVVINDYGRTTTEQIQGSPN